jgi:hypothetical protein
VFIHPVGGAATYFCVVKRHILLFNCCSCNDFLPIK